MRKQWEQVMKLGRIHEKGTSNKLDDNDIKTIIATMEFFGANDLWIKQTVFDLKICKYKVYDWLAMCLDGRYKGYSKDDTINLQALKVLTYSFIKSMGNYVKFIEDLRYSDYEVDNKWEDIWS